MDFTEFVQGLSAEMRHIAVSVANTSRGKTLLKNIRPLIRREEGGFSDWLEDMHKYFAVVQVADEDKCQAALLTTGGKVGQYVFRLVSETPHLTWNALRDTLRAYYGIDSNPQVQFTELANIKQRQNEAIQDYTQRVVRLAERAYVGTDRASPVVQNQVVNFFTKGLRDREIRSVVLRAEPRSLDEAQRAAVAENEWKIRLGADSDCDHEPMEVCHARRRVPVETVSSDNNKGRSRAQKKDVGGNWRKYRDYDKGREEQVILCWRCGREGHIQRFCRWRAPGNGRGPFVRRPANGTMRYRRM